MCFYFTGSDSCQGDSGGPLMNIRDENGQSVYEWVGKVFFRFSLYGRIGKLLIEV